MSKRRIHLVPSGLSFQAGEDETVLNAALRQGIPLRYGCRHGNCSSCKYLASIGEIDLGNASPYALSEREREEGWALLCCSRALSELEIQVPEDPAQRLLPMIQPLDFSAILLANEPVSRDLRRLHLRLDHAIDFHPGQFLEVEAPSHPDAWRSYSIANAPGHGDEIELIIKRIPGGLFSGQLETFTPGAPLRVRGPYGTSYLREGDAPILLIAGGSGIAPMLSMLEAAAERRDSRPIIFYYGARTACDLPLQDRIASFEWRCISMRYLPVLSEPTASCAWKGPVGTVAQLIQRELADASQFDAYICGPPPMCDTVLTILSAKGLQEERVFLDRFYSAVDP